MNLISQICYSTRNHSESAIPPVKLECSYRIVMQCHRPDVIFNNVNAGLLCMLRYEISVLPCLQKNV